MTVSFFFITSSKEVFKCLTWYTFFVFGFVLLPFQNYWISPRFSLPFFSSFHYKLRLLIPLLTIVSKYSAGENLISLGMKNVQFDWSHKAKNLSLYCFWFEGKWTFFLLIYIFAKPVISVISNLLIPPNIVRLHLFWLIIYISLLTEITNINSHIEFYLKGLLPKF